MIKKFVSGFFLVGLMTSSLVYGNSSIENIDSKLQEYQSSMVNTLDEQNDKLIDKKDELQKNLKKEKNYEILTELGYLNSDTFKQIGQAYKTVRNNILNEYSDLDSSLYNLKNKKELGILSGSQYEDRLEKINIDVQNYKKTYTGIVNNFYKERKVQLESYKEKYKNKSEQYSGVLYNIKSNEKKFLELLDDYKNLESLVEKVDSLYIGNQGDIHSFMDKIKQTTKKELQKKLNKIVDEYKSQNVNLDYYNQRINSYLDSVILTYKDDFEKQFDNILKGFYSQQAYKTVDSTVQELKEKYYDDKKNLEYSLLTGKKLSKIKQTKEKISTLTGSINSKMQEFDDPETKKGLKKSLKNDIISFYKKKKKDVVKQLELYLEEKQELINYKIKDEQQKYNNLLERKDRLNMDSIMVVSNYQNDIKDFKKDMIDQQLKNNLEKEYWELEKKLAELRISKEGYNKYSSSYPNIDQKLDKIVAGLQKKYQDKGQFKKFKEKIQGGLEKIDNFVQDDRVSDKNKYVLLKIKKYFIEYLYLV